MRIVQMYKKLARLETKPLINRRKIQAQKYQIQGAEGVRDIYATSITGHGIGSGSGEYCVNKNSYQTYPSMVVQGYKMFNGCTDYGAELHGALISSRVAFIGGEGPTVISDNKIVEKWANDWLKLNKLDGERNARFMEMGELEGKALIRLHPTNNPPAWLNDGNGYISVQGLPWYSTKYNVKRDPRNADIIKSITYKEKGTEGNVRSIPETQAVFVQLGGTDHEPNETVYALMRCLSQIEAASRAFYDLNHISNLYGFPKPCYEVPHSSPKADREINNIVEHLSTPRKPNEAYVGTGRHYYSSPDPGSVEAIEEALKVAFRIISFNSDNT